jgi:hypothetical protein
MDQGLRRISGILAATLHLVLCCAGFSYAAGAADDFGFDPATGRVTGYAGTDAEIVIPPSIGGVTVTAIGARAFERNRRLTRVEIPPTVREVGRYAFSGCTSLVYANIPSCAAVDANYVFAGCTSMTSGAIGAEWDDPESAYADCIALERVGIAAGVTALGWYTFADCVSLERVVLPASLESLGTSTFLDSGVRTLVFEGADPPDSAGWLLYSAFRGARALERIEVPGASLDEYIAAFTPDLERAGLAAQVTFAAIEENSGETDAGDGEDTDTDSDSATDGGSDSGIADDTATDSAVEDDTDSDSATDGGTPPVIPAPGPESPPSTGDGDSATDGGTPPVIPAPEPESPPGTGTDDTPPRRPLCSPAFSGRGNPSVVLWADSASSDGLRSGTWNTVIPGGVTAEREDPESTPGTGDGNAVSPDTGGAPSPDTGDDVPFTLPRPLVLFGLLSLAAALTFIALTSRDKDRDTRARRKNRA